MFTLFLFGLKKILDQTSVKTMLKEKIEHFVNLNVNYESVDTVIFPFPGIQIKGLKVEDSGKRICMVEDILVTFDFRKIFQSEFQIRSIEVRGGEINIERSEDGSFPIQSKFKSDAEEVEQGLEKVEEGPKALFSLLPKKIGVKDVKLVYSDLSNKAINELNFSDFDLNIGKDKTSIELKLLGDANKNPFLIISATSLSTDEWNLSALRTKTHIELKHFMLSRMGDIIEIFPMARLSDTYLDVNLDIEKKNENIISLSVERFYIGEIKNRKGDSLPPLNLSLKLDLNSENSSLILKSSNLQYGNAVNVSLNGSFAKDKKEVSAFRIFSERLDIDPLMYMVKLFKNIEPSKSIYFKADKNLHSKEVANNAKTKNELPQINLDIDLKKLSMSGKYLSYLKGPIEIKDQIITFKNVHAGIFDGQVFASGNFDLKSKTLYADANLTSINIEKAIGSATNDRLLTGRLRSNLVIDLRLKQPGRQSPQLKLNSKFHIDKGQLIGYANFIKPVAEVGKLFNFTGNGGESTAFESIDGSVALINSKVQLNSFEMKGVGLNASGSGVYDADGKIDMKFTVSLAGMVGKAVKLPIIYRGYYGKNFAFIDPVWLGTVYTGTMLGGPLGTVIGSMAGSEASEKVDATIGNVKDKFSSIKGFFLDEQKDTKGNK